MRSTWGHAFKRQSHHELLLCWRQPRLMLQSVLFFVMMMLFFPMTLPASPSLLKAVGVGLIWIACLFAALLAAEGLFQRAFEEGCLEQAQVSGQPMCVMILAVLLVHTMVHLVPIIILCPFICAFFDISGHEAFILAMSLLLGAPALFGLTALAAAFNVGRMQRTTLMALVVLPLTVPVMIFGASAIHLDQVQGTANPLFAMLAAISLLCLGGLPLAIVGVLQLRFED
jgi:heme exporter protein B